MCGPLNASTFSGPFSCRQREGWQCTPREERHLAGVLKVRASRRRGWPRYAPPLPSLRQPLPGHGRRKADAEPCPQHKSPIACAVPAFSSIAAATGAPALMNSSDIDCSSLKIATTVPSLDTKTMSIAIRVSYIHIFTRREPWKSKIIPPVVASAVRSMSPRSCSSGVVANSSSNPYDHVRVTISVGSTCAPCAAEMISIICGSASLAPPVTLFLLKALKLMAPWEQPTGPKSHGKFSSHFERAFPREARAALS